MRGCEVGQYGYGAVEGVAVGNVSGDRQTVSSPSHIKSRTGGGDVDGRLDWRGRSSVGGTEGLSPESGLLRVVVVEQLGSGCGRNEWNGAFGRQQRQGAGKLRRRREAERKK